MKKKTGWNIAKIIVGALIFSLAVNVFAIPNNLGEGGVTGLTMMLYYLFDWTPAITTLIFNGILLIIGYKFLDRMTIVWTIVAISFTSLFLHFSEPLAFVANQTIVAAIFAGIMMGLGMGLIMNGGGTTAGSAILAKIANKYLGWNTSYALLFFDLIVVIPSVFVIGFENMLFTVVSLYISTKVLDFILEGYNPKKSVTIISDHYEDIAAEIDANLERGITLFNGQGFYMRQDKKILYIVISRDQLLPLTKIVNKYDEKAFFIINDVQSVVGEGFTKQITSE
ncbi:YitT family protein [Listeria sp. FSL L7-1485]|uniref:YitT family protein n=1 Tax=Listeria immobilis TaxID=2713502 RepID=A0A7X0X6L2_9LIST|nr:YitT family protein [Listeria immobilis]MBC1484615.1 YitT family protein [Listeria immobilis]MBC1488562.1 YitT family protein [Listeria immobilis]MBC1506147.1 YitT family protein [Listeria immobilis]MBC1511131.1 YitT family protein [Listeria immobilis]MBC1515299.1 YitT family protein [Listeria immobilis]